MRDRSRLTFAIEAIGCPETDEGPLVEAAGRDDLEIVDLDRLYHGD